MADKFLSRFPIVSLVVCLIAVVILCFLGGWQVERLQWKKNLQRNLDAAFAQKYPTPFTEEKLQFIQKGQVTRGFAEGQVDISKAVLFHGRIQDGQSVLAVIVPLSISSLGRTVAVEIGCAVHPDIKDLSFLKNARLTIMGIIRQPRWSFASPANIPEKGQWWRIDTRELGAYWGMQNLENLVITAENTKALVPTLNACPIEKKLRNDHASYAVFWFSMAGILLVIWGVRFLKPYLQSA